MAQYVEPHSGIHSWEDNKLFHKYEHGQLDNTAYKESIFGVNLVPIFPRFSRIRTEYGLRIESECGKIREKCGPEKLRIRTLLTQCKERKWLETDSPSFLALKTVVENKKILVGMKYLSKFCQTENLEVFHSIVNKYCQKWFHFTLEGMIEDTVGIVKL